MVPGQFKNKFYFLSSCACKKPHSFKDNQAFRDVKVVSENGDNNYYSAV